MLKPNASFLLFIRLVFVYLGLMLLCRLGFLILNTEFLAEPGIMEFVQGIRFDLLAFSFVFLPIVLVCAIFLPYFHKGLAFAKYYFISATTIFILANCIDIIYFRFTLKRTTWDIFRYTSTGDDVAGLIPQFLKDYYYLIFIFLILVFLTVYLTNRVFERYEDTDEKLSAKINFTVVILSLTILGMRGGIQLKPLNIMDASRYTSGQNAPLMLCTPFTMIKTIGKEQLKEVEYFTSKDELLKYFNPVFANHIDSIDRKKNVVIIIMESLSKEYIGFYNNGKGYTPFLDSLMKRSVVFDNAYANGKRSIEALPAIFSGLPNLMNEAFNTTPYAGNRLSSLAEILNNEGYYTSFFHGGKNGTMGFDSYTRQVGFQDYFGLNEYPNGEDFDGSWGIYDLPYFQYLAGKQDSFKEPWMTAVFSLSAHHPYKLPDDYKSECPEGDLEIHPMICYSDIALKKYFKTVSKKEWYANTMFLITADHTAQSSVKEYNNSLGSYAIPLIVFDPTYETGITLHNTTQQSDISPTVIDYLNLDGKGVFFGHTAFGEKYPGFAINYLAGIYQFVDDNYYLQFDGKEVIAVFDYKSDKNLENNLLKNNKVDWKSSELKMKAVIQEYNHRMINNSLTLND